MALRWNFNEKVGELLTEETINGETRQFIHPLYTGNAFLIMTNEWEENGVGKYSMYRFWADEDHMKIMLGLKADRAGEKRNCYEGGYDRWVKIRLSKRCRYLNKITNALVKAFDNITIEIYTEEK